MDSIKDLLKARETGAVRHLLRNTDETNSQERTPYVPDHCVCASLPGGEKMGWVYATHYTDGTPILRDNEDWKPEYGEAFRCACGVAKDEKRYQAFLWREANIPPSRWSDQWSFSDYECASDLHQTAKDAVVEWCSGAGNRWCFLHGPVGTGKTHLACAAVAALVGGKVYARYEWVPELIDYLRIHQVDGLYEERIAQLRAVEALVLDDLNAVKQTEWAEGEVLKLIDWRYRERAPLLVTTNVLLHEIETRTLDRLQDWQLSKSVPMLFESYRSQREQ